MKPVSHQSMPPSVSDGHRALDHMLGAANVLYCEKCGFTCTDATVFKKHMLVHMGTRFYCFYCNHASFSEAELNAHLKQHTSTYPFKCPHCGQGYMRRLCLMKHIERLHSKSIGYGPAKIPHVPISSALQSAPTADTSPRPLVRVTVPAPSASAFRQGKDEQRGKTLETHLSNASNGRTELLSPLNGLIQHNRALTVSLPEEVTIPAGCLVELVEVKTVNGTKELKLRLVSQQENESVIKDTRTTVSQNIALGKHLSSTLNPPNTVKSVISLGNTQTNSRKQYDSKAVNVQHSTVVPANIPLNLPNHLNKEKNGLKRSSQEIINLESPATMSIKVPKSILNPVREGKSGVTVTQREPANRNAAPVTSSRVANRLSSTLHPENMAACVSQRAADERKNLIPAHLKSVPPGRANDIKNIPQDLSMAVKQEPNESQAKNNAALLGVPLPAGAQVRPSAISVCKNDIANSSYVAHRTLNESSSFKTPRIYKSSNSKISPWNQAGRFDERARERDTPEPEGFPVISSVFSLSQQPGDAQGPIQPLVMALRGIVMDKSNSSVNTIRDRAKTTKSTEQVKDTPTSGNCAVSRKDGALTSECVLTELPKDTVKVEEQDKSTQHPALTHSHSLVKEEKNRVPPADSNKSSHIPDTKSAKEEETISKIATRVDESGTADTPQPTAKSENDVSSKFLTVSLKRIQVGGWKKNKKGLKLRLSKYKTQVPMGSDCTVIYPMPLKVDQLVKRPGPYQPVVVLNHPKPRASLQATRADTFAHTGASEVVPKCQILKMRLGKVMGQKYEVMGCTVGVSP